MSTFEDGSMGRQERTEEEKREALRLSAEALEKSKAAYHLYLEAYQAWQETGTAANGKNAVDDMWLQYTEAYNDYLAIYRTGTGTHGYQEKPSPKRHE
ncbi:MAG: hypothetical protein WAW00_02835 [Candidatus Moraniibacteriota bacterium]